MTVMYLLIAFSLVIATGFVIAFVWAIRSGQYDDRYTPSVRMLYDDEKPISGKKTDNKETSDTNRLSNSEIKQTANNSTQTTN